MSGLDDIARILFPDNRSRQRAFIVVWLEIKYADRQFLPSCEPLASRYGITRRTVEGVRAKLKKLGLIRRVSHFSPEHGHRAGWTFSDRFGQALTGFGAHIREATHPADGKMAEQKDRDSLLYL